MAQNPYMPPPMGMPMQNPEVQSLRSLLSVVRIIAGIVLVLLTIALLFFIGLAAVTFGFGLIFAIPVLIIFVFVLISFMQIGEIRSMVDAGHYQEAKEKTLIWMILGFIFGGIIIGLLLLFAYIKFDDVIRWQRQSQMAAAPPGWGAPVMPPPGAPAPAPMMTMPPPAPVPPAAPGVAMCPRCGRPATWIAQYNRWYCYTDQQYV